ncbi:Predicted ATPase [Amycolatopsis xylanica]|uniref:Predicted ATPase n=1 Tax=Amycolatopsis xylanica TaxID=589385 RepID=A0A1H3PN24_9PSEU|nr:tetratricopeptide repeat protein [Amycolatopsis xylanica]SDZ02330.1 Predicted ATPase [Amycolatopsis xylanica]
MSSGPADTDGPDPRRVEKLDDLVRELALLSARAARGSGKPKVSLAELAKRLGLPPSSKSTVHSYVSGKTLVPSETLDAMVIALGATGEEQREWANAWFRVSGARRKKQAQGVNTLIGADPDFTGRQDELDELEALVTAKTVLAIDGMAGIGKTTLAVELARRLAGRYPDGQLFIDLQANTDEELEPSQALARLLSMLKKSPASQPSGDAEWGEVWRAALVGKRLLVVLDNASSTEQVEQLLPGSTGSLVLVTSRRRLDGLRIRGAASYSLDVLPHEPAVALFTGVARRPGDDPAIIDEIVRLCGGLPLAIRVVAAGLAARPGWTVADMADELRDEQTRLRAMRAENKSVRAAFELSYRRLTEAEQIVFRRLGLHVPGELGLPVAVALGGVGPAAGRDAMDRLVEYSLVREPARHRYRLHDLLRQFARECASETDPRPDRKRATARALDCYLHTALTAHATLVPHRPVKDEVTEVPALARSFDSEQAAISWCDLELDNLLRCRSMAAEFDLQPYFWRIPRAIAHYLGLRANLADAGNQYGLGLSVASIGNDPQAVADMTARIGDINNAHGNHAAAIDGFLGAREHYLRLGDLVAAADMLNRAGVGHRMNGQNGRALEEHRRALAEHTELGDVYGQAESHYLIAMVHRVVGEYPVALDHHRQAIERYRSLNYALGEARSLANIGVIHRMREDYDAALECYPRALEVYQDAGDQRGIANTLNNMASALVQAGRPDDAMPLLEEAAAIFSTIRNPGGVADVLRVAAGLNADLGKLADAEAQLREALGIYRSTRAWFGTAGALRQLATVLRESGRPGEALELARESLETYRSDVHSRGGEAGALTEIAGCLLAVGEHQDARAYAERARALSADLGARTTKRLEELLDSLGAE